MVRLSLFRILHHGLWHAVRVAINKLCTHYSSWSGFPYNNLTSHNLIWFQHLRYRYGSFFYHTSVIIFRSDQPSQFQHYQKCDIFIFDLSVPVYQLSCFYCVRLKEQSITWSTRMMNCFLVHFHSYPFLMSKLLYC